MTTCVDATALFDILRGDDRLAVESRRLLRSAARKDDLVISEPAFAEVSAAIRDLGDLDAFLKDCGIRLIRSTPPSLSHAGRAWREYTGRRRAGLECSACGAMSQPTCGSCGVALRSRQHMIADFVVGAHAMANGGKLITRDAGYYKTYFPDLKLL